MATAAELLRDLMAGVPSHVHPVADDESRFVINPSTRQIEKVGREPNILIQGDHNSEVYTFELPRYIEGHDMMLCNRIYVHINNIDAETKEENEDLAEMYDLMPDEDNPDIVSSSWTIRRESVQKVGILSFAIEYQCVDEDGEITYEWHTDIYSDVEVREGRNNGPAAIIEYNSILEQWRERLFGGGESVVSEIISTADTKLAEITAEAEKQKTEISTVAGSVTEEGEKQIADIIAEGEAQVQAVVSTKNETLAAIELKTNEALDSIPEDYTTVYNMAEEALRTKANAIVLDAEGEAIIVDDASDGYFQSFKLYGKTTQKTTTGKNLWNNDAMVLGIPSAMTKTDTGFSFVRGDITLGSYVYYAMPLATGQTITMSCNGSNYRPTVVIYSDKIYGTQVASGVGSVTYTATEDFENLIFAVIVNSSDGDNEFTNIQIELGGAVTNYEPYTGGLASPNPEYPQELVSNGNDGTLMVNVHGANLWSDVEAKAGSANMWGTISGPQGSKNERYNDYKVIAGLDKLYLRYSATAEDLGDPDAPDLLWTGISFYDSEKNFISREVRGGTNQLGYFEVSLEIPVPEGAAYMIASARFYSDGKYVLSAIPIEEDFADIPTQYFEIPRTLPGIPVTSGGNYTDSNGQQWICDEIDFKRGVYVQRIYNQTIDASKIGSIDNTYVEFGAYCAVAADHPLMADDNNAMVMSDFANGIPSAYRSAVSLAEAYRVYSSASGYAVIRYPASVGEVTIEKAREDFDGRSISYILATPIETPLTSEEILAYKALKTNYPNTTLVNDAGAHMEMSYAADTLIFLRDNQPAPTDEQVQTSIDNYLDETGVQVPSDEHIRQIAEESGGTVKSVNGAVPDEDGNITIDVITDAELAELLAALEAEV